LTASISVKLEPGRTVVVVVLEDVAAVELYRMEFKPIHIVFEYLVKKPHNCEAFFNPLISNFIK